MESIKKPILKEDVLVALKKEICENSDLEILISYVSSFERRTLSDLSTKIESLLHCFGESSALVNKVFSISVEGLENIITHGIPTKNNCIEGHYILFKSDEKYVLSLGNYVSKKQKEYLASYLASLNSMTHERIREMYRDILAESIKNGKVEIGLGFVTMIMKSRHQIQYQCLQMDNELFYFERRVSVDRTPRLN